MMLKINSLKKELASFADKKQAAILSRFFKTGPGEYGEGDIFLGIKVPVQRQIAKKYEELSLKDLEHILHSRIHEERLVALIILVCKYKKADEEAKGKIFKFYLKNTKWINNWDLVDLSSYHIVGEYLLDKPRFLLYTLAKSKNLWERRIAIISTFTLLRHKDFKDTIVISEILLGDKQDLIHKAVGWMLREMGKREKQELIKFLDKNYSRMPRTCLRYSIEKLSESEKKYYLAKK
jgi:3-methyladenine DNA glycosylase AlkD